MPTTEKASLEDIDRAPTNLPASDISFSAENVGNILTKTDLLSQEKYALEDEIRRLKRDKRTSDLLDSLIRPFAYSTFSFMTAYCVFVGTILFRQQAGWAVVPISDDVMKVLVGSTAVTVIGLVGMILTGIFVGARPK